MCAFVQMCVYVCEWWWWWRSVCVCANTCVCVCVCAHTYVFVCMYTCVCILCNVYFGGCFVLLTLPFVCGQCLSARGEWQLKSSVATSPVWMELFTSLTLSWDTYTTLPRMKLNSILQHSKWWLIEMNTSTCAQQVASLKEQTQLCYTESDSLKGQTQPYYTVSNDIQMKTQQHYLKGVNSLIQSIKTFFEKNLKQN